MWVNGEERNVCFFSLLDHDLTQTYGVQIYERYNDLLNISLSGEQSQDKV